VNDGRLVASVATGLITGVVTLISATSFAALIFSGQLAPFIASGVNMVLLTAALAGFLVTLSSSYSGTIAVPLDRIAPLFALLTTAVVAEIPPELPPQVRFHSAITAIILSTLLTGACLTILGMLRLGSLTRFIPYPVIGGFLAGTGLLLAIGAFRVMCGDARLWELAQPPLLLQWLPGALIALVALVLTRRLRHFLVLPCVLLGGLLLCYGGLLLAGIGPAEASAHGWLAGPFPGADRLEFLTWRAFTEASWSAVLSAPAAYGTIVLVSVVSVLLNSTALEVEAGEDIQLDHELRVTGAANLAIGVAGGTVGMLSLSLTSLALRVGVRGRIAGLTAAVVCGVALVVGPGAVEMLPRALLGGFLLFLGLSFLYDWLVAGWSKLPRSDYFVVWLILVGVGVGGYLQGVLIGLIAAVILFVVKYSRVDVVKHELTGSNQRSNVDRPLPQVRLLQDIGAAIYILKLQGYLFFGTANRLLMQLRERLADQKSAPLRFAVLDFRRVAGLDSSAVLSFARMTQIAQRSGFVLVLAGAGAAVSRQLEEGGLHADEPSLRVFPDLDHAMEWCENLLLGGQSEIGSLPGDSGLAGLLENPDDAARLAGWLETREFKAGDRLIRQGDSAGELYYVESGEVTVLLELGEGHSLRLRKMGPGTVIGEAGVYLGERRNASVAADGPVRVQCLTAANLRRIEAENPALAVAFHRGIAKLLAERLANSNRTLREVLD